MYTYTKFQRVIFASTYRFGFIYRLKTRHDFDTSVDDILCLIDKKNYSLLLRMNHILQRQFVEDQQQ